MIETGISTHAFAYNELTPEIIKLIAVNGFDSVELYMHKPHFNFDDEAVVDSIAKSLHKNGLKLNSIHCPFYRQIEEAKDGKWLNITSSSSELRMESIDWTKRAIGLAEKIKFKYAVLHFGDITNQEFSQGLLEHGAESLREIVDFASDVGVTLALENIPNALASCARLHEFMEKYGFSDDVAVCFDTGHASMAGEIVSGIELFGKKIKTVHLHDTIKNTDEHLCPGEGILDWREILSSLKTRGYRGRLILENKWGDSIESTIENAWKSAEMLREIWAII